MTSADRAAELRAQADALDSLAGLEESAAAAKAAYRDDPSTENRAAHRDASAALNRARAQASQATVTIGGDAAPSADDAPTGEGD